MNLFKIDREIEYKGIIYKVVENLNSDTLLVVEKEIFEKGEYPMQVCIIPAE